MPKGSTFIYWDSSVFLAYLNGEAERVPIIEAILEDCERTKKKILTSILAKVEVAYIQVERDQGVLRPDVQTAIDDFWSDHSMIEFVEVHEEIANGARDLLRYSISQKWPGLKPYDATHLATAQWAAKLMTVTEFSTYDKRLAKYHSRIGLHIGEPWIPQRRLIQP